MNRHYLLVAAVFLAACQGPKGDKGDPGNPPAAVLLCDERDDHAQQRQRLDRQRRCKTDTDIPVEGWCYAVPAPTNAHISIDDPSTGITPSVRRRRAGPAPGAGRAHRLRTHLSQSATRGRTSAAPPRSSRHPAPGATVSVWLNELRLIGNLGSGPEVKAVAGNRAVATLLIAANEASKDAKGQAQQRTECHPIEVRDSQAGPPASTSTLARSAKTPRCAPRGFHGGGLVRCT